MKTQVSFAFMSWMKLKRIYKMRLLKGKQKASDGSPVENNVFFKNHKHE